MTASNLSKRLRVGSDEIETECPKCSNIINESIACSGCKLSYCLKCAKISVALYNCIQMGEMEQFMTSATFPSLESITSVLTDLRRSNDERIDELETELKQLKMAIKKILKSQLNV